MKGNLKQSATPDGNDYALTVKAGDRLSASWKPREAWFGRTLLKPVGSGCPGECLKICEYGFSRNVQQRNRALGRNGRTIPSAVRLAQVILGIRDNGVGILEKVRSRFDLEDHRQAILELIKGKLTTDPKHHTGGGFFCTSRF